jgi:hypothetical protein
MPHTAPDIPGFVALKPDWICEHMQSLFEEIPNWFPFFPSFCDDFFAESRVGKELTLDGHTWLPTYFRDKPNARECLLLTAKDGSRAYFYVRASADTDLATLEREAASPMFTLTVILPSECKEQCGVGA